jgi:hypothetical protein
MNYQNKIGWQELQQRIVRGYTLVGIHRFSKLVKAGLMFRLK